MTEESIARHIRAGAFDDSLLEIAAAAESRLTEVRRARTVADFGIGDTVRFNNLCATKYLHGHVGVVISKSRASLLVKLSIPVGRFSKLVAGEWEGSEIRVSPSIIDLV